MSPPASPSPWSRSCQALFAAGLFGLLTLQTATVSAEAEELPCASGSLKQQGLMIGGGAADSQPDLLVSGPCQVDAAGDYLYGDVRIVDKGRLIFVEQNDPAEPAARTQNFWAKSIVIENGGSLEAGTPEKPYGAGGDGLATLNIVLYGADRLKGKTNLRDTTLASYPNEGEGVACNQPRCGIPATVWDGGMSTLEPVPQDVVGYPGAPKDYFYPYHPLRFDRGRMDRYFGYKVLALSYGGSLKLYGRKGAVYDKAVDADVLNTGDSWRRLGAHLKSGATELTLDGTVPASWKPGDRIVVTPTDYLPNHAEEFQIKAVKGSTIEFEQAKVPETSSEINGQAKWFHNGERYDLGRLKAAAAAGTAYGKANKANELLDGAETRAAVGLLSRSIRIVSGGDLPGQPFDWESEQERAAALKTWGADSVRAKSATEIAKEQGKTYMLGGHTIFRQGFRQLQVQGVEFRWLGMGGRIGHYPVHFHMGRQVPADTFIKDSSVNESMNRWYVLHATHGVTLQRNIGFKSIGHGYYLEDATETDNRFYSNLGVLARAGVESPANPRKVPGILSWGVGMTQGGDDAARVRSDILYPTHFWITNGWNDFVGNMAAGSQTCGACYWLIPATDNANMKGMKWGGYAALQQRMAGTSPLKQFYKNSCSTAMHAFTNIGSSSNCGAVAVLGGDFTPLDGANNLLHPIAGYAPEPYLKKEIAQDSYYPHTDGDRSPTICTPKPVGEAGDTCLKVDKCNYGKPENCATNAVDSFTTSFNWPETNFGAIWMRKNWNLVDRLFMSDIQNGGMGLITGGDYTESSIPVGFWSMLSHSVFVGETQKNVETGYKIPAKGNPYAAAGGPLVHGAEREATTTVCDYAVTNNLGNRPGNACVVREAGIGYPNSNWSTNRMINIYDGPFYQDANAYLDIEVSRCDKWENCMYYFVAGARKAKATMEKQKGWTGYLPNAAIGWKQPNGFYYPPAFFSRRLHFDTVDIRHYLTVPLFKDGTYLPNAKRVNEEFFGGGVLADLPSNFFSGFTDVDRQTVLNDIDGTLTGFKETISLNQDPFFSAPVQTAECLSNVGVTQAGACAGSQSKDQTTPTARTSPYQHVTTVIYPKCATKAAAGKNAWPCGSNSEQIPDTVGATRITSEPGRGGTWSKDCTAPFCTGVRLYRQFLTSDAKVPGGREWQRWEKNGCNDMTKWKGGAADPDWVKNCDKPFIRLAGGSLWQRSALTANDGVFYIDTTRSRDFQRKEEALGKPAEKNDVYVECDFRKEGNCSPRSVSVFEPGKSYYLFLVFAKPDTKQTYQLYVGDKFKPATGVKPIRMVVPGINFEPSDWATQQQALTAQMIAGADPATKDVLELTFDFAKLPGDVIIDPKKDLKGDRVCKPASFCTGNGSSCGCALKDGNPLLAHMEGLKKNAKMTLKETCDMVCGYWATYDLDCPKGGCLGFEITMPTTGFQADDRNHRPMPKVFPIAEANSPWHTTAFDRLDSSAAAGACSYDKGNVPTLPGTANSKCLAAESVYFQQE